MGKVHLPQVYAKSERTAIPFLCKFRVHPLEVMNVWRTQKEKNIPNNNNNKTAATRCLCNFNYDMRGAGWLVDYGSQLRLTILIGGCCCSGTHSPFTQFYPVIISAVSEWREEKEEVAAIRKRTKLWMWRGDYKCLFICLARHSFIALEKIILHFNRPSGVPSSSIALPSIVCWSNFIAVL